MAAFAEQLRRHLTALHAAGVRFVPLAGPAPELPAFADEPEPVAEVDHAGLALEQLAAEVARCERCPSLFSTRTQAVFGGGPVGAAVGFVGDAPHADDDRTGGLFAGEVGELLNKMLTAMGFGRDEVYLCSALKCRPPKNRTPKADESAACRSHLARQLELARPQFLCALGATAAQALLDTTEPLPALRGTVHSYRGTPVVCTYHPAEVLANAKLKGPCWDDFKLLLKAMGRPLPGK